MRSSLVGVGLLGAAASFHSAYIFAAEAVPFSEEQMRRCLERSVLTADKSMTVRRLEEACTLLLNQSNNTVMKSENKSSDSTATNPGDTDPQPTTRMLNDRGLLEALNRSNRFVLTPHKRNYILPFSYTDSPNTAPYKQALANDEK